MTTACDPIVADRRHGPLFFIADVRAANYGLNMRVRALCCLIGFTSLSACGKWETRDRVLSPDGEALAHIDVKLRGASGSDRLRINVENAGRGKLISPGEVVSADGAIVSATRVLWVRSDELHVVLCGATGYQVRARLLRDPVTRNDGSENAVSVEVENWRYSENQKRCIRG